MTILTKRGLLSLMVEGGAKTFSSFLRAGVADELVLFVAPRVLGQGISWIAFPGVTTIRDGLQVAGPKITRIGDDLLYRVRLNTRESRD